MLLYGEQADACAEYESTPSPCQCCTSTSTPGLSVHLHLLQHEVGVVFEEGWRNSIALSINRIIIKSSPGAAVYPDQLPRVAAAHLLSLYVQCKLE